MCTNFLYVTCMKNCSILLITVSLQSRYLSVSSFWFVSNRFHHHCTAGRYNQQYSIGMELLSCSLLQSNLNLTKVSQNILKNIRFLSIYYIILKIKEQYKIFFNKTCIFYYQDCTSSLHITAPGTVVQHRP